MSVSAAFAVALAAVATPAPAHAHQAGLCVGPKAGCFATVRGALHAAHNGDTIHIAKGSFQGGVTITKSVHLIGSGQRATRIHGGGPVITLKTRHGKKPTVTISALTVQGGRTTGKGPFSEGGGINVLAAGTPRHPLPGPTLTLRNVTVTHNEATALKTSSSPSGVKCPHHDCPYAQANGGGIANAGNLTLIHSTISGNRLDGRLSDADGAGIFSQFGTLKVLSSVVTANRAEPKKIGRFSEGGGIFVNDSALVVRHSTISHNRADLVTSWPIMGQGVLIDMNANSGGIHVGDDGSAVIDHSQIVHNEISAKDPTGEPLAFDSAMLVGNSHLRMSHTVIADNTGTVRAATTADVGFSGTALELDAGGSVTDSRISDNAATTTSPHGVAAAGNAVGVYDFFSDPRQVTFTRATIRGNTATAITTSGTSTVQGAGVLNNSLLHLVDSTVQGNTGNVQGGTNPSAQGGGVWNGVLLSGPPVTLTLDGTSITGNVLTGPGGATLQGGGLYTTSPITRTNSPIANNHPDQCFGC
jgi:hypothetical protein